MAVKEQISIDKSDLLTAWTVLENLAVSLDQIGGAFGCKGGSSNGLESQRAFEDALTTYLTPDLVKSINEARLLLAQYIADDEAELLSDRIPYWDYAHSRETPQPNR